MAASHPNAAISDTFGDASGAVMPTSASDGSRRELASRAEIRLDSTCTFDPRFFDETNMIAGRSGTLSGRRLLYCTHADDHTPFIGTVACGSAWTPRPVRRKV
jgi:hypothetical protein